MSKFRILLEVIIEGPSLGAAVGSVEAELVTKWAHFPAGIASSNVISAVKLESRGPAT